MKTSKLAFILLATVTCASASAAGLRDTIRNNIRHYNPEVGFYQKAYSDSGDPRFMFGDDKGILEFGIGGTLRVVGFYDFCGAVDGDEFTPSAISIPTDYSNQFGTRVSGSEIHAKVRVNVGKLKKHKFIGFLKLGGTNEDKIKISQAYISFDGLSIGKMPSFFMDLEAGPQTVNGKGPNTQVDVTRTAFGYTYRFPKHWEIAASIEQGSLSIDGVDMSSFSPAMYIYQDYQEVPDIVAKVKYRGKLGHVQVAGVYRKMNYWVSKEPVKTVEDGVTRSCDGYGIAVSGNINACKWLKLTGQFVWGRGISSYLEDLADIHCAAGAKKELKDGMPVLVATPVIGGYAAAQMNFTKNISASLTYGVAKVYHETNVIYASNLDYTMYAAANVFWNFSDYASAGLEYLFGSNNVYPETALDPDHGHANRVALSVSIFF